MAKKLRMNGTRIRADQAKIDQYNVSTEQWEPFIGEETNDIASLKQSALLTKVAIIYLITEIIGNIEPKTYINSYLPTLGIEPYVIPWDTSTPKLNSNLVTIAGGITLKKGSEIVIGFAGTEWGIKFYLVTDHYIPYGTEKTVKYEADGVFRNVTWSVGSSLELNIIDINSQNKLKAFAHNTEFTIDFNI